LERRETLAEPVRTIAVLVANPALSSILSMVLASVPNFRVRTFESEVALVTYMRLAPVDVVVTDFDSVSARADRVTCDLRADTAIPYHDYQVIALASAVSPATKDLCIASGIDEVIVKPMSPKYLLERVQSRLARRAASVAVRRPARQPTPRRPDFSQYSNVIPLWTRERPLPQH
jgi:two-component system phosphate regulon response regulator PhoB